MGTLTPLEYDGRLPKGNCSDRKEHVGHIYKSKTLGWYWCKGVTHGKQ